MAPLEVTAKPNLVSLRLMGVLLWGLKWPIYDYYTDLCAMWHTTYHFDRNACMNGSIIVLYCKIMYNQFIG